VNEATAHHHRQKTFASSTATQNITTNARYFIQGSFIVPTNPKGTKLPSYYVRKPTSEKKRENRYFIMAKYFADSIANSIPKAIIQVRPFPRKN
jgi:hypothetical protein